jgi:D-glycero-D-manno-heptose 1,7-bisphosphate phosphatase
MNEQNKAIFLDRDGVINVEKNYLYKIEDFEFIDGVFDACKHFQNCGYKIVIVTNQSGIGRGYYTQNDFDSLTVWMLEEFQKNEIIIDLVHCCPHTPDFGCDCRKPNTQMIDDAVKKLNIDVNKSWLIGDKSSDIQCAINAGVENTIQVESGHKVDKKLSMAKYVLPTLKESVTVIN